MTFSIAFLLTIGYFFLGLFVLSVLLKVLFKLPKEVVRKFQHLGYAFSIFLFLELYDPWYFALIAIGLLILTIFVGLWLFEGTRYYKRYLVDRIIHGGELKYSLLQAQGMFAILIALFVGVLPYGNATIVITAVMSWGFGDALAALVGKRFGKRKNVLKGADLTKTQVGSTAMGISVFIVIFFTLLLHGGILWWVALIAALVVAPLASIIEAYVQKGLDTISLPIAIAFLVYGIIVIFTIGGVL